MEETATTLVCDRWPLPLKQGRGGFYAYLKTASAKNAACFLHLASDLPTGLHVVEHFGGVGQFGTIIQQAIHPRRHLIFDIDTDCVAQLKSAFAQSPNVHAGFGDAKELMGNVEADLVVLDFPMATIKHHSEWPWQRVMETHPRYIIWSDTALRRLGLHRATYTKLFGSPIHSHEDYVQAYSRFMWITYGYSITREAHHVYSYFRAEPCVMPAPIELHHV